MAKRKATAQELEKARSVLSEYLLGKRGTHHDCSGWRQAFAAAEDVNPDCAVCKAIAIVKLAQASAPWRDGSESTLRALPEFREGQIAYQGGRQQLTDCPYSSFEITRKLSEALGVGTLVSGLVWEFVYFQKFTAWCAGFNSAPEPHLTLVQ